MTDSVPTWNPDWETEDNRAVDRFSASLKAKLANAREKGRSGWDAKEGCVQQFLSDELRRHVDKADPLDVASFSMFLHLRGEAICPSLVAKSARHSEAALRVALENLAREMRAMLRANPKKDGGLYRQRLTEAEAVLAEFSPTPSEIGWRQRQGGSE